MGKGKFRPPQIRHLLTDRPETHIGPGGLPHMPNFVKVGIREWVGQTPSLSHVLVLPFCFYQSYGSC